MIDIGRDNRTAAGDFGPNELRIEAFAKRDELHLSSNDSLPRVVHLSDRPGASTDGPMQCGRNPLRRQ